MKQTFTLLLAFLISISMYAYPAFSKLTISSTAKSTLRVMVDGNRYKANGNNNSVMLNNLQPGYHSVKIYQAIRNFRAAPGNANGGYRLLYSANVYVKPQYHIDITVNRFGRIFKDEQPVAGNYNGNDDDDNWDDNEWSNNDGNNNWNNDYNTNRAMNTQEFGLFKESLRNESFDNTRLNIARQVMNTNYFTTAQVKEVVGLFSFENSKLDIAKHGYKNTIDKNQYYTVGDAFSFSSSKEELMTYIQQYR